MTIDFSRPERAKDPRTPGARLAARLTSVGVLAVALLAAYLVARTPRAHGAPGTQDFIEYWAANQVVTNGGNPYDAVKLLAVEQAAGRADSVPLMMWNPPWLLAVMRPVLDRPYQQAASIWMAVNIVLAVLACLLVLRAYRRERLLAIDHLPATLGLVLSVPLVMTLQLGQVSVLLLFAVALLYWALAKRREVLAGIALALLSLKPHLFLLIALIVVVDTLQRRRSGIIVGAAAATAGLLGVTYLRAPTLFADWARGMSTTPVGAPAALTWRTPNLPNVVRELLAHYTGSGPSWPLTVIPLVGIAVCALWWYVRAEQRMVHQAFPLILCWSVIVAPFGWTFDHVVLAVPQVLIFVRAFTEVQSAAQRWILLAAVIGCHLGLVVQSQAMTTDYFQFWWYPPVLCGIWLLSSRFAVVPPLPQHQR